MSLTLGVLISPRWCNGSRGSPADETQMFINYQKYSPSNPIWNTLLNFSTEILADPGLPCLINTHSNLSNVPGAFSSLPFKSQICFCTRHWIPFIVLQLHSLFFGSSMEPLPFSFEFLSICCRTGKPGKWSTESQYVMSEGIASGSFSPTQAIRLLKSLLICRIRLPEKKSVFKITSASAVFVKLFQ